jgi:hypothetical protein
MSSVLFAAICTGTQLLSSYFPNTTNEKSRARGPANRPSSGSALLAHSGFGMPRIVATQTAILMEQSIAFGQSKIVLKPLPVLSKISSETPPVPQSGETVI